MPTTIYRTEDGKEFFSLLEAQMHEAVATAEVYLDSWREERIFKALLSNFNIIPKEPAE